MDQSNRSLNTQPSPRASLPIALTSFVGRERETADVAQLLASARLVSLIGAGGSGKTRLALQVAAEIAGQFADGVCWVDLVRLADPSLVTQAVAKALNVNEQPDLPLLDSLLEKLRGKHMLLVLDNCEHVLAACADLVEALLRATPATILTTSREPLGIEGEALYPVPPLALPAARQSAAEASQFDAVRLFVERARSTRPDFAFNDENATAIVAICRRLDGMPLGIELASARVNVLSASQIAERLDHRLDFLVSPARGDERHRTLRATIDWSYELLPPAEQALLRRLAVFASGFTLTTAESACGWGEIQRAQVLELLASLVNKSLVATETLQGSEARYRLLETIRQYAQEILEAAGEWDAAHDHCLDCFLRLAEEVAPKLKESYQHLWFNWLETEHDNIRAALAWALERGRIEAGLRIGIALFIFWQTRAYVREGRTWFERFLSQADEGVPLAVRANALVWASFFSEILGDAATATTRGQEAVALCEAAGEEGKSLLPFALAGLTSGTKATGDYQATYALGERLIELYRERGESYYLGVTVFIQGEMATALGKYETAQRLLEEGLALARDAGDTTRVAIAFLDLGNLARCEQRFAQAQSAYGQSLSLFRELGSVRETPMALHNLAYIYLYQGDIQRAHALFLESLEAQHMQGDRKGVLDGLRGFAALATVNGMAAEGARLFAAAIAHGKGESAILRPPEKLDYEHYIGLAKAKLSTAAFEAEQDKGRALSIEQAIEYALNLSLPGSAPSQDKRAASPELTEREREVAALIAQGLSNGEIAGKLVLSKRTVEKHVANTLSKLGLTNRAQIVRWAVEHGLASVLRDDAQG